MMSTSLSAFIVSDEAPRPTATDDNGKTNHPNP